jgi:hypothetical protein
MLGCVCWCVWWGYSDLALAVGRGLIGGVINFMVVLCVVLCQQERGGVLGEIRWGRSGVMSTNRLTYQSINQSINQQQHKSRNKG